MTLPANDAFSLGLAHDQPRRPSPKILLSPARGMSPKRPHRRRHASDTKPKSHRAPSGPTPPDGLHRPNGSPIDWEIPRKALHSSIGFFTIYLYSSNGDLQRVIVALSSALAVLIPIDILRLRYPSLEHAFERCVGIFMRDSEKKTSNGVIWYILGVNAVLVALPLDIAVVSVLILSWADTAASTFGRLYGSRTPRLPKRLFGFLPLAPRKSLAGFIAATLTGTAISMGFWSLLAPTRPHELTWTWQQGVSQSFIGNVPGESGSSPMFAGWMGLFTIGVVAGLVTGIAEALDLGGVDDNLSLPVIAGGCLWGLFKMLGWLGRVLA